MWAKAERAEPRASPGKLEGGFMGQLWDVPTGWGAVRPDSQRGYGHLVLKAKSTQRALLTQKSDEINTCFTWVILQSWAWCVGWGRD